MLQCEHIARKTTTLAGSAPQVHSGHFAAAVSLLLQDHLGQRGRHAVHLGLCREYCWRHLQPWTQWEARMQVLRGSESALLAATQQEPELAAVA